jgi:peptide deformylase
MNPIVQAGDPVLRARAAEVPLERIPTPEIQALVATMIERMRAAPGVGLAAPQIGVGLRVFVLEDPAAFQAKLTEEERRERGRVPVPLRVLFNPVVTPVGDEKVGFFEGCLSVEGYAGWVERFVEVEVRGHDEHAQPQAWRVRGWPARILQHEMDHLEGTLYVDRMVTRSFATAEHARARFAGKSLAETRRLLGLDP